MLLFLIATSFLFLKISSKEDKASLSTSDSNKSAVFALAVGYSIDDLSPFVISLRYTGYRGSILFGVGFSVTEKLQSFADKYGVTLKVVDRRPTRACSLCSLSLALSRYTFYLQWLKEIDKNIEKILITDVRDVVFQTNPFLEFSPRDSSRIFAFEESFNFSIDTKRPFKTPWNRNWIVEAYGSKGLNKIGKETIICSGTTISGRNGMKHYLSVMVEELERLRKPCPQNKCCSCGESKGLDQGIHNFLIHTGQIQNVSRKIYGESFVLTLGSLRYTDHTIIQDKSGFVLNALGKRASILHQYNRIPLEMKWLKEIQSINRSGGV